MGDAPRLILRIDETRQPYALCTSRSLFQFVAWMALCAHAFAARFWKARNVVVPRILIYVEARLTRIPAIRVAAARLCPLWRCNAGTCTSGTSGLPHFGHSFCLFLPGLSFEDGWRSGGGTSKFMNTIT